MFERHYSSEKKMNRPSKMRSFQSGSLPRFDNSNLSHRHGDQYQREMNGQFSQTRNQNINLSHNYNHNHNHYQDQNRNHNIRQALFNFAREKSVFLILVSIFLICLLMISGEQSQEECFQIYKDLKCDYQHLTEECQRYFTCFQTETLDYHQIIGKVKKAFFGFIFALIVKLSHRYLPQWRQIFQ